MAGVITPIVRSAFEGPSPLFLFDANVRGAGKTLLAQSVGCIALGRDLGVSNYSADPEELRKQITAIVIAGDPAILFDNLQGAIGGSTFDRMLTATYWSDRILGTNTTVNLPLRTTWYGTGNNVMLHGDTCRRTLHCRLDVLEENPEDREGFTHPDLMAWIRRERTRLVVASLTIVAAYLKAGRPALGLKPMGSFEGWSDVVRQSVVWAGCPDPCTTRDGLASMADSDTIALGSLLDTFAQFDCERRGFIVSELITRCWGQNGALPTDEVSVAVRSSVESLLGLPAGKPPSSKSLGKKLSGWRRRNVHGRILDAHPNEIRCGSQVWRIAQAGSTHPSTEV